MSIEIKFVTMDFYDLERLQDEMDTAIEAYIGWVDDMSFRVQDHARAVGILSVVINRAEALMQSAIRIRMLIRAIQAEPAPPGYTWFTDPSGRKILMPTYSHAAAA
jgi:hypothetical protein